MNKRIYGLIGLMALLVCTATLASAGDLTLLESDAVGTNPNAIAVGGFKTSGDANKDLAIANYNGSSVTVLLNKRDGSGMFGGRMDYTVGTNPHAVAAASFKGDGFLDLAVANVGGKVSILLNKRDGSGMFNAKVDYDAGSLPYAVAAGDFNHDGKMDLAVVNEAAGVSILLNNGDGTFGAASFISLPGALPSAVVVGDFNAGVKQDLAITDSTGNVILLLGKNNGKFQPPKIIPVTLPMPFTISRPYAIVTDDLDGDTKADLVLTDYNSFVVVMLGKGGGNFKAPDAYAVGRVPTSVAVGDVNHDGKKDLIVANSFSGTVTIWHGIGNGKFHLNEDTSTGLLSSFVVAADFKNNGHTDVAVALYFSNTVSILLGQ
jgi:hypothetical protein